MQGTIEIKKISITDMDCDAIVNAANSGLLAGGGVCGAIFKAAGYEELQAACNKIGHCDTGSAVITPAFNMKNNKFIIHAVGPDLKIKGNPTEKEKQQLYGAYTSSLKLAKENKIRTIGFPLISAGIFGYPMHRAWKQALKACTDFIKENSDYPIRIEFAIRDDNILEAGRKILNGIQEEMGFPTSVSEYDALLTNELDKKAKAFMSESLLFLKALFEDEYLRDWCREFDFEDEEHAELFNLFENNILGRAYDDGLIIKEYNNVISANKIDETLIFNPTDEFIDSLSKIQIIACIAYLYRADHFDNGRLMNIDVAGGHLITYFEGYLRKKI